MKKIILLVLLSMCIMACKKNAPIAPLPPAPATGSVNGTVAPVNAFNNVTVTSAAGSQSYPLAINPLTGSFSLDGLPGGDYLMNFSTTSFYEKIEARPFTVKGGKTTEAGTINASTISFPLSCIVAAQFRGWYGKAVYESSTFKLSSVGSGSDKITFPEEQHALSISLYNVTGPGTYTCDPGTTNAVRYVVTRSILVSTQTTQKMGSTITVVITAIDPVARKIQGTFSGRLAASSETKLDAKTIAGGVINVSY